MSEDKEKQREELSSRLIRACSFWSEDDKIVDELSDDLLLSGDHLNHTSKLSWVSIVLLVVVVFDNMIVIINVVC